MDFIRRHATGTTMVLYAGLVLLLSALPLPDWARPLGWFQTEDPAAAVLKSLFSQADSADFSRWQEQDSAADAVALEDLGQSGSDTPVKDEVVPEAAPERTRWVRPRNERFDRYVKKVGAAPQPLVNPCVEGTEQACTRRALDRFFSRLEQAERGEGGRIRVVHFGDSLIASDHITDMVRLRLQQRFGSGGRGFLLVDRLSRFAGRRVRTGEASLGWELDVITARNPQDKFFGYTGASFTAVKDGEHTVFDVGANRSVEIFYFASPKGGVMEVYADATLLRTVKTESAAKECRIESLELPVGTKSLRLRAKTHGVRIFGVALEAKVPGVVYESVGLPGATAKVWMFPDEDNFKRQLERRDPALVVTMLGGNDGLMLSKKRTTIEEIEQHTRDFLKRLRAAAPGADCLITSPMDAARAKVGGAMSSKPEVQEIIAMQKRVLEGSGCAYWDMWTSMGGTGSLERWWNAGLINPDMIHPKGYGGDLLGEMMALAIMDAYDAKQGHAPTDAGYIALEDDAFVALGPVFEKLAAGEKVVVAQIGEDLAGEKDRFVREVAQILGRRFPSIDYARDAKGASLVVHAGGLALASAEALADGYSAALEASVPAGPCLLIGPTSTMKKGEGEAWADFAATDLVVEAQRAFATARGCAFWPARKAMGGADSAEAWFQLQPRLVVEDRKTLTKEGLEELARLFASDLVTHFERWEASRK